MKNFITAIICGIILGVTIYYINPITDYISNIIQRENKIITPPTNEYTKTTDYKFVQNTTNFTPYSYQDLINIYYSIINNGWEQFTFYCPNEYKSCIEDTKKISQKKSILSRRLNNFVHPYNSFFEAKTESRSLNEITVKINYRYNDKQIEQINNKVDEIIENQITKDQSDYEKIKIIHDYIIKNTKYDVKAAKNNIENNISNTAYGALFNGLATCNGYTDLMAIFLTKLGFDNYEIATTSDEISYKAKGHVWNAVKINDTWLHLDLTWDDPVSNDNKDYLFHRYFLITTEELEKIDGGRIPIEAHNFNKKIYLEFN